MQFNLYYWHGLVSYNNYRNWTLNLCNTDSPPNRQLCNQIFNQTVNELGQIYEEVTGGPPIPLPSLDPDDLYQDFCTGNGTLAFSENQPEEEGQCIPVDQLLKNYLNRQDVQEAIHVFNPPVQWSACSTSLNYSRSYASMLPFYLQIFKEKPQLNILIYSGDVDIATVPFAVTQKCLADLNLPQKNKWGPWYVNEATAGYFEDTERFTFATLKGAGHEAPVYQTLNAFNMFQRFLTSQNLGSNSIPPSPRSNPLRQSSVLREFQKNY